MSNPVPPAAPVPEPELSPGVPGRVSWSGMLQAAAGVAVVAAGLAAAGGAGWAFVAAQQAVQGRLVAFAVAAPRAPAVQAPIEVAENAPAGDPY